MSNPEPSVAPPQKKKATDGARLGFVDDTRGIAVVLMIFWHTVEGWMRPSVQVGQGYQAMVSFGGLAAPMFLLLAGVGTALKLAADGAKGVPRQKTILELSCRGLEVVVSGYALRVFMWLVDSTAIDEMSLAPAFVPLTLGLVGMYVGFGGVAKRKLWGLLLVVLGAVSWGVGWWQTSILEPTQIPRLARVDVLQTIGFSIVFIATTEPLVRWVRHPALGVIIGIVIAGLTGFAERGLPGNLHPGVAAYLGRWTTGVGPSVAMFPLFPWVGYAVVGTTVGVAWFRGERAGKTALTVLAVACVGAAVGMLTNENMSFTFWTLKKAEALFGQEIGRAARMLQKVGFALALSGAFYVVTQRIGRFPLRTLGNTSMFIYWVHLELVYGIIAKGVTDSLHLYTWFLAFVGLTALMALAARARVRAAQYFARKPTVSSLPSHEG